MSLRLSRKKFVPIFIMIIIVALLLGGYFYFLNPLKTEIKMLKDQLSTEEKLYDTLAQQVGDTKTSVMENSRYLQKRLPVESFLEQFILDLEKAEVVSNSLIEDMSFQDNEITENDVVFENNEGQADEQEQTSTEAEQEEAANENKSAENGEQAAAVPSIPEGMKRVTVNLTVTSENYFDMLRFLETIESLERITKIDSLSFDGGKEILSVDDEIEELTYTVVLSTFYYPALEELKDELPVFDTPQPAKKDNPLPTGMYYKDGKTKEAEKEDQSETVILDIAETILEHSDIPDKLQQKTESKPKEQTKTEKQRAVMSGNSATDN